MSEQTISKSGLARVLHRLKGPNTLDWIFVGISLVLIVVFTVLFFCDPFGDQACLFFIKTGDFFADYFNVCKMSYGLNPYFLGLEDPKPYEHAYPPLNYVIFYFLARFADYANLSATDAGYTTMGLASAFIVVLVWVMLLFAALRQAYGKRGVLSVVLLFCILISSIVLFSIERANIVLLSAACMSFFVVGYRSENKVIRELALICLALATALKGYPALMGMLLLYDKQVAAAIRCAIYAIALIFLPFLALQGGFDNIPVWLHNISLNSDFYKENTPAFGFGVISGAVSTLTGVARDGIVADVIGLVGKIVCVVGLLSCFALKRQWQKVLLLGLCLVSLQTNSAEYLGLYLLIGIVLFFAERNHSTIDLLCVVAFIIMLCPLQIVTASNNSMTFLAMGLAADALLIVLTVKAVVNSVMFIKNKVKGDKSGN